MRNQKRKQVFEKNKITTNDLTEIDTSNIPNREFKVITLKIFTGPEKRVEDIIKKLKEKTQEKKYNQIGTQQMELKIHQLE